MMPPAHGWHLESYQLGSCGLLHAAPQVCRMNAPRDCGCQEGAGCTSAYRASAHLIFADVPLAKASNVAKRRVHEGGVDATAWGTGDVLCCFVGAMIVTGYHKHNAWAIENAQEMLMLTHSCMPAPCPLLGRALRSLRARGGVSMHGLPQQSAAWD